MDPKRSTLRAKPARVPRRITIRMSGFVWSLIGASVVGGILNTVGIVILALSVAK